MAGTQVNARKRESTPGDVAAPDLRDSVQDSWLDQLDSDESAQGASVGPAWFAGLVEGPVRRARLIFAFLMTTPGVMIAITTLLSVAIFAAGYSMSQSSAQRQDSLDVLLSATEPLSYTTHNLYSNLSQADTIATTGFVQPGVETDRSVANYHQAIDRAAVSATRVAEGLPDGDRQLSLLVTTIQRELPVYTGMVESARAQSRVGNPVGVTYMANASALMRDSILPAAAQLFSLTSDRVGQQQQSLSEPQWVPLSGLFAAVGFLTLAQWWLWRVTHRRLNKGFTAATLLMAVAIVWVSASNFVTWQAGTQGFQQASQPWDNLTTARIQAQQARTSETLALVRRESMDSTTESFNQMDNTVTTAVNSYAQAPGADQRAIADARRALAEWRGAHQQLSAALMAGEFEYALHLSSDQVPIAGQPATAAGAYNRLDNALTTLSSDARASMRTFIGSGLAATSLVATAVMILALISIAAIWIGIRPRLQEYL